MAASATKSTTLTAPASSTYKYTFKVSFTEDQIYVDNNRSKVTITASIGADKIAFSNTGGGEIKTYWHDNKNNQDYSVGTLTVDSAGKDYGTKTLTSTFYVTHKDDGTLSGYAKAVWTKKKNNSYIPADGNVQTANTALTTIPRASKPTATSGYIGQSITISTNRMSSSFTHTLTYSFGSLTGTIATGVGESYGWTIPTSFYSQIPNTDRGTVTISCTTYNGSTQIGTAQTTTFVALCDTEVCKPTFDFNAVLIDGTSTTSLTGSSNIFIANYSEVEAQWTATANNSATISNVKITGGSQTYTTSPINLNFSQNSSLFTNGISLTCTDSRNISTVVNKDYTIKQWFSPNFTMNASRTSPTGSEVVATFSGNFFNESFGAVSNTLTLTWKYKEKGATTWTDGGTLTKDTHYVIDGNNVYSGTTTGTANSISLSTTVFDYTKSYDVGIFFSDRITSNAYVEKNVPKGKPVFWWNEHGVYEGENNKPFITEDVTGDIEDLETEDKTSLVNAINEIAGVEDITSKITWNETIANTKAFKQGKQITVQFQGEGKAHAADALLGTFPENLRPSYQVVAPFTKNNNAYGFLTLTSNGQLRVGLISSTSASGRIYANFTYYLD